MSWNRKQGNKEHGYDRTKDEHLSGSKAIDHTCRSHGSCPHCIDSRAFHKRKTKVKFSDEVANDISDPDEEETSWLNYNFNCDEEYLPE